MTFSRIKPFGFAANSELASADMNLLDIDHANALDKTSAGDTLSGVVAVAASGGINANASGAVIQASAAGAVIDANTGGVITATGTGRIRSKTAGGVQLGGGSSDWPTFTDSSGSASARTRTVVLNPTMVGPSTGWTSLWPSGNYVNAGVYGPGTAVPVAFSLNGGLHNGATLTGVELVFYVPPGSHAGGAPANLPTLDVLRGSLTTGLVTNSLSSVGSVIFTPTPASGAAWIAGSAVQSIVFTADQNNVIDTSQYCYWVAASDEYGTNAASGNQYIGLKLTYGSIADMRFQ